MPPATRSGAALALLLAAVTGWVTGCGRAPQPSAELARITEEFVFASLALSPVSATGAGYHRHDGVSLDTQLDDWSPAGVEKQRAFYRSLEARLEPFLRVALIPDDAADLAILQDQVALSLLELDTIQAFRHNPALYVETIGTALFTPYLLRYAPEAERFGHIAARLKAVPRFLEAARSNLLDAPEVWNRVAREENEGNIGLIETTLRDAAPAALRAEFDRAAAKAIPALRDFNRWLETALAARTSDWRLGREKYARKFRHALGTQSSPQQLLAEAEQALEATRREMLELAAPGTPAADPVRLSQVVRAALDRVAQRHATPATYLAEARRDLDEARRFVRERNLLTLPARDNLQVIETPVFLRGIYAVGGFNSAPALEPGLGAFYWITPIPEIWPKERIESKLREYNTYGLKLLTIHEAMPGHYVQLEYANGVEPRSRRLLRSVYGNGPYVEGWAVYATERMLDSGYLDNSPDLRLTFLKQQLRVMANTILDIRLHTAGMTDEQAMSLMLDSTFQEREEATAKLQRAKLSSAQLPTYFAGYQDWRKLRAQRIATEKNRFTEPGFHDRALATGAVPMRMLAALLQ